MDDDKTQEIIDFINVKYEQEVPGPVKFVVKRNVKKIEKIDLNDFPENYPREVNKNRLFNEIQNC